jgi:hypothetical protein
VHWIIKNAPNIENNKNKPPEFELALVNFEVKKG